MITIFKPAEVTVTVIDGAPPTDQTATVAALQVQVMALEAERDALQAKIAAAQAALA